MLLESTALVLMLHATVRKLCSWHECLMADALIVCRWLRDEALSDGMLYATSPCLEDPI